MKKAGKPRDASLRNTGDYFLKVGNGSTGKKKQNPQTYPMRFKN